MKSTKKERSGQSLVELAISLIAILILLLGAVEFGLALFKYVTMRDAAQEGAIYGSVNPTDETGMKSRAVDAASDVVTIDPADPPDGNVDVNINGQACEGVDETTGTPNSITVTITIAHPISFPLVGPAIGSNAINLTASVTNTILRPKCDD